MKITLSLSAICLFASISTALVVTDGTSSNEMLDGIASRFPSHIIKLKASNLKNITGKYESKSTTLFI